MKSRRWKTPHWRRNCAAAGEPEMRVACSERDAFGTEMVSRLGRTITDRAETTKLRVRNFCRFRNCSRQIQHFADRNIKNAATNRKSRNLTTKQRCNLPKFRNFSHIYKFHIPYFFYYKPGALLFGGLGEGGPTWRQMTYPAWGGGATGVMVPPPLQGFKGRMSETGDTSVGKPSAHFWFWQSCPLSEPKHPPPLLRRKGQKRNQRPPLRRKGIGSLRKESPQIPTSAPTSAPTKI